MGTEFEEWLETECPKPNELSDSHWLFIRAYMSKAYEAGHEQGFKDGVNAGADYAEYYKVV